MLAILVFMTIEFRIFGEQELDHAFLFFTLFASTSMSVNQSFNREYGPATKQFLSSLPITKEEMIASQVVNVVASALLYVGIAAFGCVIMPYWEGFYYLLFIAVLSISGGGIYIFLYHSVSFAIAQVFFLGIMMPVPYLNKYLGASIGKWVIFHHWYWLLLIMLGAIIISASSLLLLLKKKGGL